MVKRVTDLGSNNAQVWQAQGGSCRGWGLPNTGIEMAGEMTY